MEIVNSRIIKKFVVYASAVSIILTSIPILLYCDNFDGKFSPNPQDWGIFGDYIGGIIGSFFSLLSVLFSLIGIYITLKIATHIHNVETRNNQENLDRELEKSKKEIELLCKQYKPYPHIDYNSSPDFHEVILSNQGPGTLIVTNWHIIHNEQKHQTFIDVIISEIIDEKFDEIFMNWEKLNHICISSGGQTVLFATLKEKNMECDFAGFIEKCENLFFKCEIIIEYEDIFGTNYSLKQKINF